MKRIIALLLSLLTLLSLAACGGDAQENTAPPTGESASEPVAVTDMIGREVNVTPGSYKRVVCIGAGALRLYSYVGDVSLLCGVEDIDNTGLTNRPKMFDQVARPYVLAFGETFQTLPSCGVGGPNAQTAEAEKILSCAPDIIISEYEDVDKENALQEQLGVPVITMRTGPGSIFDDAFAGSLTLLGRIFGRETAAQTLIDFVKKEIAEVGRRTGSVSEADKPSVYLCGLGNWGTTNHLMTAQNFAAMNAANIKNVVSGLAKNGIQSIEKEKFAELGEQTDVMIIDAAAVKNIKPLYAEDKTLFDGVKAWKNGEVYLEMAYNAYYTNYEISLVNLWFMAKTVYPSLFEDIDLTAKTNEITSAFFGKELADAIFALPQSFGGYQKIDTATFFG